MKAALGYLNWLIDKGVEYPDAVYRAATAFRVSQDELQNEYDGQYSDS